MKLYFGNFNVFIVADSFVADFSKKKYLPILIAEKF